MLQHLTRLDFYIKLMKTSLLTAWHEIFKTASWKKTLYKQVFSPLIKVAELSDEYHLPFNMRFKVAVLFQ